MKTRLLPVVGVALALVALSGCDQSPQTAAHVGSRTISVHDVHLMTQALCTEQGTAPATAGPVAASSLAVVTQSAVSALIQSTVDAQYAAEHHLSYDRVSLAQQVGKVDPLIAKLPAADRARTRTLISDLFKGELQVFQQAVATIQASGQQPSQQSVQQAASQIESTYAKTLKIKLNPRYDTPGVGRTGDGSQSLSKSVSSAARTAEKAKTAQPDESWVAALPAAQKCG